MTKQEIVKQIARETGVEAATVLAVVEGFMEEVRAAQIRKENVFLRGFGTFLIKHRKEKTARNITKNTTIKIPAHDIPAFKPSPDFQRLLEKKRLPQRPDSDVRIGALSFYRCRWPVRHSDVRGLRGTSPARCPSTDV